MLAEGCTHAGAVVQDLTAIDRTQGLQPPDVGIVVDGVPGSIQEQGYVLTVGNLFSLADGSSAGIAAMQHIILRRNIEP
jgi:hypothetical protein